MEIKTGSQEEINALERIENKRIASAERKWKIELRDKRIADRRSDWLDHLRRSEGGSFAVYLSLFVLATCAAVCMVKAAWHYFG